MESEDPEQAALRAKYARVTPSWTLPPFLQSPRVQLLLLLLVVALGYIVSLRVPLQRSDDFYKVIGAWSLAEGRGYSDISRPDAPPLTKYPPLGSLSIAPFMGLVGESLRPLRLLSMLCCLLSLPLLYRLLTPRVGQRLALLFVALFALHPVNLRILNFEGNAGLMVLLMISALYLVERKLGVWPWQKLGLLLGILLALYFYAHRIGIVFAVGMGGYLLYRREWRTAVLALTLFAVLSFPWLWRSYQVSGHWVSPEYEGEIAGRVQGSAAASESGVLLFVRHLGENIASFPSEMGHHLFPWSRASGGQPWPLLVRYRLVWLGTLSEWGVTLLMLVGFLRVFRTDRRAVECYLPVHTMMLLTFFVGAQYYLLFLPWLYFYLWRGLELLLRPMRAETRRRGLALAFATISLVLLAKDTKAFWLTRSTHVDRDLRWAWVAQFVPKTEAVYYLHLDNYAFAPLRYFDSQRMAVGVNERELEAVLSSGDTKVRWLCLPKSEAAQFSLSEHGWTPIAAEPDFSLPTLDSAATAGMSEAQLEFLRRIEPPQVLWKHP